MVIDFAGFKKVIDLLGGISIDVPEDLNDREYPDDNWGYEVFSVKK
jgi:anionic cell wall polymer biosynthesis LytR-Cps2A-Psr (LCP) family protein